MATLYIPPPPPLSAEALSFEWANEMAKEHKVKITVTVERDQDHYHTVTFDRRREPQNGVSDE
jgi:hypothetical protein